MPFFDDDIVNLRQLNGKEWQYYWGDEVEVVEILEDRVHVRVLGHRGPINEGFVSKDVKLRNEPILRLSMIDVQQGDGLIIDTPGRKVIFIDGGDNQLFARHAAARYPGTSASDPLIVDVVIVTHGDADHFEGLSELAASETHATERKRIFCTAQRVFHNGLAKRPGKKGDEARPEREMFGSVGTVDEQDFVTSLFEDLTEVEDAELNVPFRKWKRTVEAWRDRLREVAGQDFQQRRIDQHATDAFDFLAEDGIEVEVLGPISEKLGGNPALAFLSEPPDDASLMLGSIAPTGKQRPSASHTINGHSIALRLKYGNVRFLLTGDMNEESMERLKKAVPSAALQSEILKTPHHGSADFNLDFLNEVSPVVSLISSGDESAQKEYIHPRATLMAALGKVSRTTPAVIFCTELAAFFAVKGYAKDDKGRTFFAFERTNFGIAHVRTDGQRVLAFTHSGKAGVNEAYRFTVAGDGAIDFAAKVLKRRAPAQA